MLEAARIVGGVAALLDASQGEPLVAAAARRTFRSLIGKGALVYTMGDYRPAAYAAAEKGGAR